MKLDFLENYGFFTGVPDSRLRPLCDYLIARHGTGGRHIIAANEGNCVALAAGYHLATGGVPVVYLQNSGLGNIINPVASLLNGRVYGIPCLFFIGWRGEPGVRDEPQHAFQGAVTLKLLEDMGIRSFVVGPETPDEEVARRLDEWGPLLAAGGQAAFVIRKGALAPGAGAVYSNANAMRREEVIRRVAAAAGDGLIVSTTGKASRELFEIREAAGLGHDRDFLTVGSMGHASSIALGIALQRKDRKVWCIDGDGAVLMHMGALALIGAARPANLVHVVVNNGAHESVGGMPTAAPRINLAAVAAACGYPHAARAGDCAALDRELRRAKERGGLSLIEVPAAIGARGDLGRPTSTPRENKERFMAALAESGKDRRPPPPAAPGAR